MSLHGFCGPLALVVPHALLALSECMIHSDWAVWYSDWSPMATVMNFLIAQGHSPGESNLPKRNNKVTRIFLMSAQWNWIIVLNFPLMRFLVSGECIFCNQSNLHLRGIETLKLPIMALEIKVHPSYNTVREMWES